MAVHQYLKIRLGHFISEITVFIICLRIYPSTLLWHKMLQISFYYLFTQQSIPFQGTSYRTTRKYNWLHQIIEYVVDVVMWLQLVVKQQKEQQYWQQWQQYTVMEAVVVVVNISISNNDDNNKIIIILVAAWQQWRRGVGGGVVVKAPAASIVVVEQIKKPHIKPPKKYSGLYCTVCYFIFKFTTKSIFSNCDINSCLLQYIMLLLCTQLRLPNMHYYILIFKRN